MPAELNELLEEASGQCSALSDDLHDTVEAVKSVVSRAEDVWEAASKGGEETRRRLSDLVSRLDYAEGALEDARGDAQGALDEVGSKAEGLRGRVGELMDKVHEGLRQMQEHELQLQQEATRQDSTQSATCWARPTVGEETPTKPPPMTPSCRRRTTAKLPYRVTVKDVPVAGFWTITVYNKDGFMEKNDQNVYSYNNVTAKKNAYGSITIHFGGGPGVINNLPITPGWNYIVRMYQTKKKIVNGTWSFPKAQPTK